MLAGLVPAFFGLALIAIYLVTRGERHVQEQKILDTELSSEIGEDEIAVEEGEILRQTVQRLRSSLRNRGIQK